MVESQPSKLLVAGSIPVSRSSFRSAQDDFGWQARNRSRVLVARLKVFKRPSGWPFAGEIKNGRLVGRSREAAKADVAQLAERVLGKDEVTSSILVIGSKTGQRDRSAVPEIVTSAARDAVIEPRGQR